MLAGAWLLVEPDRSDGRAQTSCNPWHSRLRVGRVDDCPTLEQLTVARSWRNRMRALCRREVVVGQ
jgi:hypothetical protein